MELDRIWTAIAISGALCASGCGSSAAAHDEWISEQGGFLDPERRLVAGEDAGYCSAEVLRWRYDASAEALQLSDARLMLDCCGQRALWVERVDTVIEITERDAPDHVHGRCEQQCAFDFSVGVQGVPQGNVYVKLLRDVVDQQGSPSLVWSGALDLGLGESAGAVVLDDTPAGASCRSRPPTRRRNGTIAAR